MRLGWILGLLGALGWIALLLIAPMAALAGARAGFLLAETVPVGAVVLLLIARLTGADWGNTLRPLLGSMPWACLAAIPMVVQQALFVVPPPHLTLWLAWPFFALRTAMALGFWWWVSRRLLAQGLSETSAGLTLVAHAVIVDIVALDWIMGVAPAQPETAIGMVLAVTQILGACSAVCWFRLGTERTRIDLSHLRLAACLGLIYLLFIDFLVVWYGNLPARVGWYLARRALPWSILPPLGVLFGLVMPIVLLSIKTDCDSSRRISAAATFVAVGLALCWLVAPIGGALALAGVLTAALAIAPVWRRGV